MKRRCALGRAVVGRRRTMTETTGERREQLAGPLQGNCYILVDMLAGSSISTRSIVQPAERKPVEY